MKIALGSDHAGLSLKRKIIKHLEEKNLEIKDFGTYTEESCDYPDYAYAVAKEVSEKNYDVFIHLPSRNRLRKYIFT